MNGYTQIKLNGHTEKITGPVINPKRFKSESENGVNLTIKELKAKVAESQYSTANNGIVTNHSNGELNGYISNGVSVNQNGHHVNGVKSSVNGAKIRGIDSDVTPGKLKYKDLYPYTKNPLTTDEYIHDMVDKIIKYLEDSNNRNKKVVNFITPDDLQKKIDFTLPDDGEDLDDISSYVDKVLKYAVKTGHPRFYNQLFSGIDTHCLLGEWINAATNTCPFTYEVAPVYTVMEKYMSEKLLSYAGFYGGEVQFFPGGSMCNFGAINLARYRRFPNIKEDGCFGMKPVIVFTSEESHYSIVKGSSLLGIGSKNVLKIKSDSSGKMLVSDLEAQIQKVLNEGKAVPLMVCATAGTTVVGAYDPINQIADVCEKYGLWMHIDGAWGGSCLISKKYRHLMDGCHRADSITWDAHKLMNCLQQCSVLLVREKGLLSKCHSMKAKYLFQEDKMAYDPSWDTGDKTYQCGRSNDVLKLTLMWKAKGSKGIEAQVENAFNNSRYLAAEIKKRKHFKLVREVECTNVCFQYIPPSLVDMPECQQKHELLDKVPPQIKRKMTEKGSILIGYQPLNNYENVFRMITVNPVVDYADMDFVLDEIELLGKDL